MQDKTPLEKDIELQERVKIPIGTFILLAFLSISLGVLGIYTLKLKQELSIKEQEIELINRNYNNEQKKLLNEIERLERECEEKEQKPN
jgi:hypothetical protein